MSSRLFLALGVAAALSCGPTPPPDSGQRVVLITCDTLRADRLGFYGYGRPVSPHLDALAEESLVFEEAYATASMTQPAVSSLMTGRLPHEVGVVYHNLARMPAEVETLAEVLRAAGISTAGVVSNAVLARAPEALGEVGVQQGFAYFDDRMQDRELGREMVERRAADTTDAAILWLASRPEGERSFLWVHYQDPHGPYTPPDEHAEHLAREPGDEPELRLSRTNTGKGMLPLYQRLGSELRPSVYRDRYDAEIRYFDAEAGRLLDWLRRNGPWERTTIIFTSDHGESLGEHDYWFCHGESLHRELVRVPLMVRFASDPTGRRSTRLASHVDLWPTVLETFGLPGDGSRGAPLDALPEERLLVQTLDPEHGRPRGFAISDGRYRAIWSTSGQEYQLFDLQDDPGETRDVAASNPERLEAMTGPVEPIFREWRRTKRAKPEGGWDEAAVRALRALGYNDG